jgi:Trypsin-like peptidase domain
VRNAAAVCALLLALAAGSAHAGAANDAAFGYETIRPSLVKVWAFDAHGRPAQSGTGIVVDTDDRHSLVLTASHVIAGSASIRIDVSRDVHDLSARVERKGPRDLTLLRVDRGNLHVAHFAPRSRAVVEGNLVAVAGYVKNDELIGIVGQEPRILFPGTVSSRPDSGQYLELENVHIEEGLSGGAVFDPGTGDVLGVITSRTSDRRGGFADSGALVVLPFLAASRLAAGPLPAAVASTPPRAAAMPRAAAAPLPALKPPQGALKAAALPAFVPQPAPVATLRANLASLPALAVTGDIASWQATNVTPKRFIVTRGACRIAITIDVRTLQFVVAHQALVAPRRRGSLLSIALEQRAGTNGACADFAEADTAAVDAAYDATAMSFDGRHVTMRFAYAGDPANADLFPADASVDADLGGDAANATVQFYDRDWSGSLVLSLARTPLAGVSSTW